MYSLSISFSYTACTEGEDTSTIQILVSSLVVFFDLYIPPKKRKRAAHPTLPFKKKAKKQKKKTISKQIVLKKKDKRKKDKRKNERKKNDIYFEKQSKKTS